MMVRGMYSLHDTCTTVVMARHERHSFKTVGRLPIGRKVHVPTDHLKASRLLRIRKNKTTDKIDWKHEKEIKIQEKTNMKKQPLNSPAHCY